MIANAEHLKPLYVEYCIVVEKNTEDFGLAFVVRRR